MPRRSSVGATAALAGLAVSPPSAREQALLRERARLLKEVQRKKRQLEQLGQKTSREADDAVVKMAPLVERQRELATELKSLFDELLAESRLVAKARKQVAKLRRALELEGLLTPLDEPVDDDQGAAWANDAEDSSRAEQPRPPRHDVASARQPAHDRRSLRDVFRNLARTVHPDRAQQEEERARRTELMKEITRAYEQGDLARLIELEVAWQSQQSAGRAVDAEARCRELERVNRELLDQSRELTRKQRDVKRQARELSLGLSPDELVLQATRELDDLENVCECVRRFRDGKLGLTELLRDRGAY